jgi:hypothetical protein
MSIGSVNKNTGATVLQAPHGAGGNTSGGMDFNSQLLEFQRVAAEQARNSMLLRQEAAKISSLREAARERGQ